MKILITGAAGYIGSMLANYLADDGHSVVCFDNFYWGQEKFVTYPLSKTKVYRESILDWSDNLKREIHNADVIYPLAALVGAPLCKANPELTKSLNEEWYNTLLLYLNKQTLIFPNTNSSYGSQKDVCTEETPLNPLSLYAETKDNAEKILLNHDRSIVFRLATVFGMSFRPRLDLLINNLTMTAVQTGKLDIFEGNFRRNYVHVMDVVRAFNFARRGFLSKGVYNLGNDSINCTKWDLANKISKIVECVVNVDENGTDNDKRDYVVSSAKLYNNGFACKYDLETGVNEIANFVRLGVDDSCFRNY